MVMGMGMGTGMAMAMGMTMAILCGCVCKLCRSKTRILLVGSVSLHNVCMCVLRRCMGVRLICSCGAANAVGDACSAGALLPCAMHVPFSNMYAHKQHSTTRDKGAALSPTGHAFFDCGDRPGGGGRLAAVSVGPPAGHGRHGVPAARLFAHQRGGHPLQLRSVIGHHAHARAELHQHRQV